MAINQARLSRRGENSQEGEEGRKEGREFSPVGNRTPYIPVASRVHVSMFVATLTRRAYLPCRSPVICSPSWPDGEEALAAAATTPSLRFNGTMSCLPNCLSSRRGYIEGIPILVITTYTG